MIIKKELQVIYKDIQLIVVGSYHPKVCGTYETPEYPASFYLNNVLIHDTDITDIVDSDALDDLEVICLDLIQDED
jgi:hypothetical protein